MKEIVAAILVSNTGKLILQLRDDKPGIASRGKIGLFGGSKEEGEDSLTAIQRELAEELELKVAVQDIANFCILDFYNKKRIIYLIKDIDSKKLVLHEGQAIVEISKEEILKTPNISYVTLAILCLYQQDLSELSTKTDHVKSDTI